MNEKQRQLLSDRLNFLSHEIERLKEDIQNKEALLERRRKSLAEYQAEHAELSEGIDW